MKAPLIFATVALAALTCPAEAQPSEQLQQRLRTFLQQQIGTPGTGPDQRASYIPTFLDLNGDGRSEALVYLIGQDLCGSGGCRLWVLTPQRQSWRVVTRTTVTNTPIRILNSRSRGWRDIAVRVSGGGARPYEARLRFDGRTYPANPSLAPASPRNAAGRVVITDDSETRALFP